MNREDFLRYLWRLKWLKRLSISVTAAAVTLGVIGGTLAIWDMFK